MVIRSAFLTNTQTLSPLADCSDRSGIVHKSVVLLNCWRHKSGNGKPTFAVARCPGSRIQPNWDPCLLATDRWSRASRLAKDIASLAQLRVQVIRTIYLHSGIDKISLVRPIRWNAYGHHWWKNNARLQEDGECAKEASKCCCWQWSFLQHFVNIENLLSGTMHFTKFGDTNSNRLVHF